MYSVYMFIFPSNKFYFGITKQKPCKRWKCGKGYKNCKFVNRAINKYGWENVRKVILFENLSEQEAKHIEISLISMYKSNNLDYGYNISGGGDLGCIPSLETREKIRQANLGKKHSEETKRKMSESRKGNKYALGVKFSDERKNAISERELGANNPMARKVICLETMKVYDTLTQAQKETGATKITDCCRHNKKHRSSGGYHWEYYDEQLSFDVYKDILSWILEEENNGKHHKMSDENKRKLIKRCSKPVICVETGEIFKSINSACFKYNLSPSNVCNCCKGIKKTTGGFTWRYA